MRSKKLGGGVGPKPQSNHLWALMLLRHLFWIKMVDWRGLLRRLDRRHFCGHRTMRASGRHCFRRPTRFLKDWAMSTIVSPMPVICERLCDSITRGLHHGAVSAKRLLSGSSYGFRELTTVIKWLTPTGRLPMQCVYD